MHFYIQAGAHGINVIVIILFRSVPMPSYRSLIPRYISRQGLY